MHKFIDAIFFLADGALIGIKKLPHVMESRLFWVWSFYIVFFFLTNAAVYVSVYKEISYGDPVVWPITLQITISSLVSLYGVWAFNYAIQREYLLWIAFVMYSTPISIFSLTYNAYDKYSAGYMVTIPSILILWLVGRWFYETIPDE